MATAKKKEIKNVSFPSKEAAGVGDFLNQLQENLKSIPSMLFDKSLPYQKLGERVITATSGSDTGETAFTFPGSIHDAGDFTSSSNLKADDGNEAAKGFPPALGDCTVDNFGFAIPVAATITQMRVRIEWRLSSAGTAAVQARWTKDGGSNWSNQLADSGSGGTSTLGSGTLNTWGAGTTITPAQANDNDNFQVQLFASSDSSTNYVDYIAVSISYSGSGETTTITTYNVATMPVTATAGSVLFAATGSDPYLEEDNDKLFFDNTNKRLGVGTNTPTATFNVEGASVFNDTGASVDFRVESNLDANIIFVDASEDFVGIGKSVPLRKLHVTDGIIIENGVAVTEFPTGSGLVLGPSDAVNEGADILLQAPGGSFTTAWRIDNYQNTLRMVSTINAGGSSSILEVLSATDLTLNVGLQVNEAGADLDSHIEGDTATNLFKIDAGLDAVQIGTTTAGVIADFRTGGIVFNENGADRDIRFEGDNNANLLTLDAGLDMIGIGEAPTTARFHILDSTTVPPINITERASAPSSPGTDDIYLDNGTNTTHGLPGFRRYTGAAWEDVGSVAVPSDYLLDTGDIGTGVYDFGGADSFEIPNAAGGTTVDATGEITIDSTSKTLNFYDGASESVLRPEMSKSITIEDPTSTEDISIFFSNVAITITEIRAVLVGSATPSVTWTIRHGTDRSAAGAEVVTGGTTTTSVSTGSDVTAFNDATVVADSFIWCETTAQSGTVTELHITIFYKYDA